MSAHAGEARPLQGRHAIVTGASRGIGLAIAAELARRGASVTLMARTLDALRERAAELARAHGVATGAVACDVANADSVRTAFARAVEEGGAPWALAFLAGWLFSSAGCKQGGDATAQEGLAAAPPNPVENPNMFPLTT